MVMRDRTGVAGRVTPISNRRKRRPMLQTSIEEITRATTGRTAPQCFIDLVRTAPDAPALRAAAGGDLRQWTTLTYAEYRDRVAATAAGLQTLHLGPGERIVLMMRNRPDFHWIDLAAQFLRVTPVSVYNSSSLDE